jgi:hypothetical protein
MHRRSLEVELRGPVLPSGLECWLSGRARRRSLSLGEFGGMGSESVFFVLVLESMWET